MVRKSPGTCFISAPAGVNTEILTRALSKQGFRPTRLDQLAPGADLLRSVEDEIRAADLVCAVVPAGRQRENVLFEMGLARGMGRRTFALVEPGVDLPPDLGGIERATLDVTDRRAVDAYLGLMLRDVLDDAREGGGRSTERKKLRPISVTAARDTIAAIASLESGARAQMFERLVASLLSDAGAQVASAPRGANEGIDLAVWVDDIDPVGGNPVLVELRVGRLSRSSLVAAATTVAGHLAKGHGNMGLLIYWDIDSKRFPRRLAEAPQVVALSIDEFLNLLEDGSLSRALIADRTDATYGRG